jgi:hypothetical protein
VGPHQSREEVDQTARRRFWGSHVTGTPPELVEYFGSLAERGIERAYVWFTDFGPPDTLAAFGRGVIAELRGS